MVGRIIFEHWTSTYKFLYTFLLLVYTPPNDTVLVREGLAAAVTRVKGMGRERRGRRGRGGSGITMRVRDEGGRIIQTTLAIRFE
jgi:hypothetical protein